MDSLHETSPTESAISAAKEQVRRQNLISAEKEKAAQVAKLPKVETLPLASTNPRTVPAHVSRRVNTSARALPPPSTNPTSRSAREAKPDKGKSKKNDGFGNNSDSDSENDHRKRNQVGHRDARVVRGEATTTVSDIGPSGQNCMSSFLTPEETERMQLKRELRAAEEKWKQFKLDREECRSRGVKKELYFIQQSLHNAWRTENEEIRRKVLADEKHIKEFCDNILFSHIEQQLSEETESEEYLLSTWNTSMEYTMSNLEHRIAMVCKSFDPDPRGLSYPIQSSYWEESGMRLEIQNHLSEIFTNIYIHLKKDILDTCKLKDEIRKRTRNFISERFLNTRERGHTDLISDALVKQYLSALAEHLTGTLTQDVDEVLDPVSHHRYLHPLSQPSRIKVDWGEFRDWAKTTLDSKCLQERIEHYFRQKVTERFRKASPNIRIRQEFIHNMDQSGEVSLLLFKGDMLTNVQRISAEKVAQLGWKQDSSESSYWRYSEGISQGTFSHVFKVQMDGEVVGMWTASGDIDWDPSWDDRIQQTQELMSDNRRRFIWSAYA